MGLFSLFFGGSDATDTRPPSAVDLHEAMLGLDIETARAAHENWKLRLDAYLAGNSSEDFSPEVVCFDDRCDLGRWIYGQGKAKLGQFPGFTALMGHHRMFHYAASNVVSLQKAGHPEQARQMLSGQFHDFSSKVQQDLDTLQRMVAANNARKR